MELSEALKKWGREKQLWGIQTKLSRFSAEDGQEL